MRPYRTRNCDQFGGSGFLSQCQRAGAAPPMQFFGGGDAAAADAPPPPWALALQQQVAGLGKQVAELQSTLKGGGRGR